ncbi:hypothetical protein JAAARDRAFT_193331 [Jaapia argillacea MUCL 33604]|uniref:Uncharacterized protein n=1 Tax=Jaapia argillacea MUCL 33604 TaxID=933084 RepID=A0A067PY65_9AGAM|nr:hypothetical protein JAAARDRAFT_193331 [Jaapia argillacea MUCL 33604]
MVKPHSVSECRDEDDSALNREEDGLGGLPDMLPPTLTGASHNLDMGPEFQLQLFLVNLSPPSPSTVDTTIKKIENILHPPCKTGCGYKVVEMNHILQAWIEMMAMQSRLFKAGDCSNWTAATLQVAAAAGKGEWLVRQIREWCHAFIKNEKNLPTHSYGKFNSSVLEDEDLAQEIHLHLQGKGKFVIRKNGFQIQELDNGF